VSERGGKPSKVLGWKAGDAGVINRRERRGVPSREIRVTLKSAQEMTPTKKKCTVQG